MAAVPPPQPAGDAAAMRGAVTRLAVLVTLLLLLGLLLAVGLTTLRRNAVFRVEATTEIVEVAIVQECNGDCQSREHQIDDATLAWNVAGTPIAVNGEPGTFEELVPGAGSRVLLRRVGSGPVVIQIEARTETAVAAVLRVADDPVAILRGFVEIETYPSADRSLTFPYFGAASVGDVVRSGGTELLLDGSVSILGSTTVGRDRFIAGTIPLRMGNEVRVPGPSGCADAGKDTSGVGVVRADGAHGMSVVHEAGASALRINRAGIAQPHCLRASLWSFFSADPLIGGLLLFGAGVLIALVQNLITFLVTGVVPLGRGRSSGRSWSPSRP